MPSLPWCQRLSHSPGVQGVLGVHVHLWVLLGPRGNRQSRISALGRTEGGGRVGHRLGTYHGSLGTFGTSWALQSKTRSVSDRSWHGGVGRQQPPTNTGRETGGPGARTSEGERASGLGEGSTWGALTGSPGGPAGPMGPVAPGIPYMTGEEQKPV